MTAAVLAELREQLATQPCSLGTSEMLAVLVGNAEATAAAVAAAGGLVALTEHPAPYRLARDAGANHAQAVRLVAALELPGRIVSLRTLRGAQVRSGGDVARTIREATRGQGRESFWSIDLDARHQVQALRMISLGSLASAPVHPREVFGPAVAGRAAAIVVAHNHPSGDPTPSGDDRAVTERLRQAGQLLGVELLDHVVVGADRYWSFADEREHPLA